MGSLLCPIIADLVLRDLEEKAFKIIDLDSNFYISYVDDVVTAVPADSIDMVLRTFNLFHNRLHFTLEVETE